LLYGKLLWMFFEVQAFPFPLCKGESRKLRILFITKRGIRTPHSIGRDNSNINA